MVPSARNCPTNIQSCDAQAKQALISVVCSAAVASIIVITILMAYADCPSQVLVVTPLPWFTIYTLQLTGYTTQAHPRLWPASSSPEPDYG